MLIRYARTAVLSAAALAASLAVCCRTSADTRQFTGSSSGSSSQQQQSGGTPAARTLRMRLDDNGDMIIRCGKMYLTLAYNAPSDPLRPPDQPRNPQKEERPAINGISIAASLSF